MSKAVDYVRDNYSDQELTIDKICGILGVSAAYFSTMFKKETGKTFIAYLTDYRMEQAVQRLIGRDEKTYVIAAQVGYADPAYFSYVFKKKFGLCGGSFLLQNIARRTAYIENCVLNMGKGEVFSNKTKGISMF